MPRLLASDGQIPNSQGMLLFAAFGVAVNGFAAWKLSRGSSQNEKVLTLHLLEDVLGWVAVLIGAILIHFFKWAWLDPLLACLISLFILWNVVKGLNGTIRIFLQYIPESVDLPKIQEEIEGMNGVKTLMDFHAWSLDGAAHVLSCSIILASPQEDPKKVKGLIRDFLKDKGFQHITIEVKEDDEEGCH